MRVLVIDDHQLFRAGMVLVLRQFHPDVQVLDAPSTTHALVHGPVSTGLDLVLMDWHLPEENPHTNIQRVKAQWPSARLVIVSAVERPPNIAQLKTLGASGFIPKTASPNIFIDGIATVMKGEFYMPKGMANAPSELVADDFSSHPLPATDPFAREIERLTPRQRQVLEALKKGLPNKQIGRDLGIAEETVKQHLSVIYEVLGVRGRTEALSLLSSTSGA